MTTDAGKMMPEALRLAELFERYAIDHEPDGWPGVRQAELNEAAAELRRLHAENELLHTRCQQAYTVGRESGREDCEALLRQALVKENKA